MTTEPGAPGQGEDPFLGAVVAGRYRLLAKIGEGGTGSVYRGVHEALRKPVAVKLLGRAASSDREVSTRFEREAVAAANLKHPNIVEATDFGQMPDGTLFLVMEYVEGSSLRAVLRREGKLPPARALHVIRQVCAAVSFAHGREVVHRDLKPENVVVYDQGDMRDLVKVIDFGIARMRSSFGGGPSGLTKVGTVVGTVEYMAPEQAMGQAVDARADQYALGVITFELLTGRPPYVADEVARLIYMHVGAPIPRATELAPELPAAVDDVIARMMGKLPEERFPTLGEALVALRSALDPTAPAESPSALMRAPGFPPVESPSALMRAPATPPQAPYAQPFAAAPLVTSGGTIVVAAGPAPAPPTARPARPAATQPGGLSRKHRDILILAGSALISLIGLAVLLMLILRRSGAPAPPEPPPSSVAARPPPPPPPPPPPEPPSLAPTSHDAHDGAGIRMPRRGRR